MKTGRKARPKPASPTARARRDRGSDTRSQLIAAALDVFGRQGFEGASTRHIAAAAKANLAAIVYHFGGKEPLHIAVAEHVAESIAARMGPTLATLASPDAISSSATAREGLHRLIGAFIEVILGSAEAEKWARFIVREQLQPTEAFDVIYKIMGGALNMATGLVATVLGRKDDETVRLLVITIMGQVLVFRVANALALRRMGWKDIGERERSAIRRLVLANVDHILDAEVSS
jgi:AcrR family transcriptional regulator